jgi:signal transduction histidine kinase
MNTQNNGRMPEAELRATSPTRDSQDFEEFVQLLSHDVRNSVRALFELPQWIKEDLIAEGYLIDGSLAENFDLMEIHTRRLDQMLLDLLTYSRVGCKQTVQSVSLVDAIQHVCAQLSIPKGFQITSNLKCKSIHMGDRDILTLLSALVSNAIKHHDRDDGAIHISSRQSGDECIISVHDDGPGIPEQHRSRVFDVMTTLNSRDEVEGSGMGLAIVRKIVEFYGGHFGWAMTDGDRHTCLEMCFMI